MSVHVDELHSEVVPVPGPAGQAGGREPEGPWAALERWRELRCHTERLAERVCAEGFDD
jgi:hypothetical protein